MPLKLRVTYSRTEVGYGPSSPHGTNNAAGGFPSSISFRVCHCRIWNTRERRPCANRSRSDQSHNKNFTVRFKEWHLSRNWHVRRRKSRGKFFCRCAAPTREFRDTAASHCSFLRLSQFPDCGLLLPLQRRQDWPLECTTVPGTIDEEFRARVVFDMVSTVEHRALLVYRV